MKRTALFLKEEQIKKLERWQEHCPENFTHKLLLAEAERLRVLGSPEVAAVRYRAAAEAAERDGFLHHAALAHELWARHHLRLGESDVALRQFAAARRAYASWGATAKLRHLDEIEI